MEKEIAKIKERIEKLEAAVFGKNDRPLKDGCVDGLDFSLNQRAFIKKYSFGFNGQKFFVLILAYLASGKESTPIDLSQLKTIWKSCSGIIGQPYASVFSTRAKENGWADTAKNTRGSYVLGKQWKDILKKNGEKS